VKVSRKLCFWDKSSPTFVLCTESGELAVICWAVDMAVESTFDAGTTVFTLRKRTKDKKVSASTQKKKKKKKRKKKKKQKNKTKKWVKR